MPIGDLRQTALVRGWFASVPLGDCRHFPGNPARRVAFWAVSEKMELVQA